MQKMPATVMASHNHDSSPTAAASHAPDFDPRRYEFRQSDAAVLQRERGSIALQRSRRGYMQGCAWPPACGQWVAGSTEAAVR
jgi:hypothetical protein